jgi:hypothetical protein
MTAAIRSRAAARLDERRVAALKMRPPEVLICWRQTQPRREVLRPWPLAHVVSGTGRWRPIATCGVRRRRRRNGPRSPVTIAPSTCSPSGRRSTSMTFTRRRSGDATPRSSRRPTDGVVGRNRLTFCFHSAHSAHLLVPRHSSTGQLTIRRSRDASPLQKSPRNGRPRALCQTREERSCTRQSAHSVG